MPTHEVALGIAGTASTVDCIVTYEDDATVGDLLEALEAPAGHGLLIDGLFAPQDRALAAVGLVNGASARIAPPGTVDGSAEAAVPDEGVDEPALIQLDGAQMGRQISLRRPVAISRRDVGRTELLDIAARDLSAGGDTLHIEQTDAGLHVRGGPHLTVDDESWDDGSGYRSIGTMLEVGGPGSAPLSIRIGTAVPQDASSTAGFVRYRPSYIDPPRNPEPPDPGVIEEPPQVDDFATEVLERAAEIAAGSFLAVMLSVISGRWFIAIIYLVIQLLRMSIVLRRMQRRNVEQRVRRAEWESRRDMQLAQLRGAIETEIHLAEQAHPPMEELARLAVNRRAGLWSRLPQEPTFLTVAIGAGVRRSDFKLKLPTSSGSDAADVRIIHDAIRDVEHFPCAVALREHHLGVVGRRVRTRGVVEHLICQLATQHSPAFVSLGAILPAVGEEFDGAAAWLKWLPHCRQPSMVLSSNRIVRGRRAALAFMRALHQRLAQLPEESGDWYAVVLVHEAAEVEVSLLEECIALAGGRLRLIWWGTAASRAPRLVDRVVTLTGPTEALDLGLDLGLAGYEPEDDTDEAEGGDAPPPRPGPGRFRIDDPNDVIGMLPGWNAMPEDPHGVMGAFTIATGDLEARSDVPRRIARALAALVDERALTASGAIPQQVRLLDLLGLATGVAAGVHADLEAIWEGSTAIEGLVSTLGMTAEGPLELDLERDGPHVLVAGTTGSGKSELLQTMVFSLAARYSPKEVTFLLVDFKGGAAFDDAAATIRREDGTLIRGLPHVLGTVDNLDSENVDRLFKYIEREIRTRMESMKGVAKSFSEYRRAGHEMPRLVVVLDEFAALLEQGAEYEKTVLSIAARGRSLGMHIVLATQRPSGVVSQQIRANVNARLCLRTLGPEDAEAVVGSNRPAFIPSDLYGRCFARLDSDQLIEFQSAWASAPLPDAEGPVRVEAFV